MDGIETFKWEQLARRQKIYIAAGAVLVAIVVGSLVWDDLKVKIENHELEKTAAQADRDKHEALDLAAKTASKIQIAEQQLSKVEDKKNVQKSEIDKGAGVISRDRAEYDRAVHDRLPNVPSTDALCKQLADAGHPCYPNP